MLTPSLFDSQEGEQQKEAGMKRARKPSRRSLLEQARGVAKQIAAERGRVTADDVVLWFHKNRGVSLNDELGNAMGSLFRGTGLRTIDFENSRRVSNHARTIRVWGV